MSGLLVGVDSGLTVTKAAVFDQAGNCLGVAAEPADRTVLPGGLVEIDPEEQWRGAARTIRGALAAAGVSAAAVAGLGVCGHGDCVYLVDAHGEPVRPAIPSLDFRGARIARDWARDGVASRLLGLIGEPPHPHHVHSTLRWLLDHEPDSLARTRWLLFAKDWLKLRLTGTVSTDPTDAAAGFTDVHSGEYSDEALRLCGLACLADRLPPVRSCGEVVGEVTQDAARQTGLAPGTPVVSGLHDISAAALGAGLADTGTALLVAGTYSVNAVLSDHPRPGEQWLCRQWAEPGRWIHMATSATSASNLDWVLDLVAPSSSPDESRYEQLARQVAEVLTDERVPVFHPYLFGIPAAENASGAVLGLRAWHSRAHVYRAVLEGIACAHRAHLDSLAPCGSVDRVLLAGGAARSPLWTQLFADILGLPVHVAAVREAGTLGAALCAAVGAGGQASLAAAMAASSRPRRVCYPDPLRRDQAAKTFRRFTSTSTAVRSVWSALDADGAPVTPDPATADPATADPATQAPVTAGERAR